MKAATVAKPAIWGEGFADDGWADALTVARFDELHPDEALRLFPRLVGTPEARDGVATMLASSVGEARVHRRHAAAEARGWQPWFVHHARPADEEALASAEVLLRTLQAARVPAYTEGSAFALAIVAGVHPGYLWREAALLADRLAAVGWVGVLRRGRSALMPLEIAEVLHDVVPLAGPRPGRLCDARFAPCGLHPGEWLRLARFADRRLRGRRDIVRLPARRFVPSLPIVGLHWSRGAAGVALSR